MSGVKILIELPEELVERARALGLDIEAHLEVFAEAVEKEIQRREAAHRLAQTAEHLRALPDEQKPTPEEIDSAIRHAREQMAAERRDTSDG